MTYRPWFDRNGTRPRVGIELEMNNSTTSGRRLGCHDLADALVGASLTHPVNNAAGYVHSDGSRWDVKTDSSCGLEVASPALTLDEEGDSADLRAATGALKALSPRVDRHCGLHVWVEVADFNWQDMRRLLALWARYETAFYAMLPHSRRGDPSEPHGVTMNWCRAMRKVDGRGRESVMWPRYKAAIAATNERGFTAAARLAAGKYQALNISQWWRTGRVEFRLHSGTLDYVKIRNWVKLLLALVARVKAAHLPTPACTTTFPWDEFDGGVTVRYMAKALGLAPSRGNEDVPETNAALLAWVTARRQRFLNPRARL